MPRTSASSLIDNPSAQTWGTDSPPRWCPSGLGASRRSSLSSVPFCFILKSWAKLVHSSSSFVRLGQPYFSPSTASDYSICSWSASLLHCYADSPISSMAESSANSSVICTWVPRPTDRSPVIICRALRVSCHYCARTKN